jgi:hypothetical protein
MTLFSAGKNGIIALLNREDPPLQQAIARHLRISFHKQSK